MESTLSFASSITFCYTDNLTRTSQWYEDVLGLSLAIDQGNCRIYHITGKGFIGFCERKAVSINHDDLILTFVTDDVDGWYQRLKEHNAIVVGKPEINEPYNVYHFFARDPNGYRIEIQQFLSPSDREVCHDPR